MKIALICEHGGHLTEMLLLMESFSDHTIFFITNTSARTEKIPYKKYLIGHVRRNPLKILVAVHTIGRILRQERPDIVISTGAEIAVPAFIAAKVLCGITTIYIESWARITSPSQSGRIVYPLSDIFLVQWPQLLDKYGKKAQFLGAVI